MQHAMFRLVATINNQILVNTKSLNFPPPVESVIYAAPFEFC